MTLDELRELNPAVRNTDMVTIGQSLVVQREQPYLQVQIAQTLTYTETVAIHHREGAGQDQVPGV